MCLACWRILKYEECVKHRAQVPEHNKTILTSKEFASEAKFLQVAKAMDKIEYRGEEEWVANPYKKRERRGRPSNFDIMNNQELK